MKALIVLLFCLPLAVQAQNVTRWFATTGQVSQVAAASTATIQQLSSGSAQTMIYLDQIVVYCSVACSITQSANGTAATATAGTITPLLPAQLNTVVPATFWTASNVGAGTAQGGAVNLPAGATVTLCLSPSCGNAGQITIGTGGSASNYSVTISSITGTSNVTFYGRVQQ